MPAAIPRSDPSRNPTPRLKAFSRLALAAAAALSLGAALESALDPELLVSVDAPQYALAADAIESMRAAGFTSSDITLGSPDGKQAPLARDAHAAIQTEALRPGDTQCDVVLSDSDSPAMIRADLDGTLVALHEASHCDARFSGWLSFRPSERLLSADQASALRGILAASLNGSASPDKSSAFETPATLFGEMAADLRALAAMAKTLPREQWRQAGWDLWMDRSFGPSAWGIDRDHNTAIAISILLSADPAKIEAAGAKDLESLVSSIASDALVLELSRQRFGGAPASHDGSLTDPASIGKAAAANLSKMTAAESWRSLPANFVDGMLESSFGGRDGLRLSAEFLASPDGAAALKSLSSRMKQLSSAPLPMAFSYRLDGQALSASLSPNLGFADLDTSRLPRSDYHTHYKNDPAGRMAASVAIHFAVERARASFPGYSPGHPDFQELLQEAPARIGASKADMNQAFHSPSPAMNGISVANLWSVAAKDPASLLGKADAHIAATYRGILLEDAGKGTGSLNQRLASALGVDHEPPARAIGGMTLGGDGFLGKLLSRRADSQAPSRPGPSP